MIFLTFIFACAIIMPSFLFFSILHTDSWVWSSARNPGMFVCSHVQEVAWLYAARSSSECKCSSSHWLYNFSGDILTFSLLGEDQELATRLLWYTCIIIPLNLVDLINAPFFIYLFFFLFKRRSIYYSN